MKITSTSFNEGEPIPVAFTCDGQDFNPPFDISGVPAGTKSLALAAEDPDAPAGTWIHWLMWNINPATGRIEKDSVPQGAVQGTTSIGRPGYHGPCPPGGKHHYYFKLFALDAMLNLSSDAARDDLEKAMASHILAQAELMGTYER